MVIQRGTGGWRSRGWSRGVLLAGLVALAAGPAAASPGQEAPAVAVAAAQDAGAVEAAEQALAQASAQRRAAYKLEGEQQEAALLEVAARYGSIASEGAWPLVARAEAAFRSGEILRARGQAAGARERFGQATELGARDPGERAQAFAARGLLEQGHLDRREGEVERALQRYAQVEQRFAQVRRSCAQARTWTGKVQLAEGRREEAFATLLGFREAFPDFPLEALRNADLVAMERLGEGDVPGARAILEDLRRAMEPLTGQPGKDGEKIRRALAMLRVTAALEGD